MIEDMLSRKMIRPSCSPWSSLVVLVPKKNGSVRCCIDYRQLNRVTRKDVYPIHRIDDILDKLRTSQYFSSLDLCACRLNWSLKLDLKLPL